MSVLASGVPTLIDIVSELAPDGSQLEVAEVLRKVNPILDDMVWVEGNTLTGHKDSVRTALPTPSFRAINSGVPVTKGASTPIEETAALLEDYSQVDAELANLAGDIGAYRVKQGRPHMQGMSQTQATTLFYGNIAANPRAYTGFGPRFNSLSGPTGGQVIDAGGTGTNLRSVYLIGWSTDTVFGIYPKGTVAGLQHEDVTQAGAGTDTMTLTDPDGKLYQGYRDHWIWRCGLMVKDWRYVVRIANIDLDTLTPDKSTGADLEDLMVIATETMQSLEGVRPAFYMPRDVSTALRRQLNTSKSAFMSWNEAGGKQIMNFSEIPTRRTDALNVDEARVS